MMGGVIDEVLVEFETKGALATTHETQGSDMGLFGGLLGYGLTDERLLNYAQDMAASDIDLRIEINDFETVSPNIYKLTLTNASGRHQLIADSIGGGMIEVLAIDAVPLSIAGDCHETLLFLEGSAEELRTFLTDHFEEAEIQIHAEGRVIEIKAQHFLDVASRARLQRRFPIQHWLELEQVLPVPSRIGIVLPFTTCEEMVAYNRMREIVLLLQNSVCVGLAGTVYEDRILGYQSGPFQKCREAGGLLDAGMLNEFIAQITALMEDKSSMGVIVPAPTAGACATLPGAVLGAGKAVTALRTAAVTGVSVRHLADPEAHTLGLVGCGAQAFDQVRHVCAARPVRRVLLPSRAQRPTHRPD